MAEQGTEVDKLFVSLGVDLSGLQRGVRKAKKALSDGLDISKEGRKAERSLGSVEDELDDVADEADHAADELGDVKRALRDVDRVGLIGAATGVDDDQVELLGTVGRLLPKIASAAGPAAVAIGGTASAVAAVGAAAGVTAGSLTKLARTLAETHGPRALRLEMAELKAETTALQRGFVRDMAPAVRATNDLFRGTQRILAGVTDEIASFVEFAGRVGQGTLSNLLGFDLVSIVQGIGSVDDGSDAAFQGLIETMEGVRREIDVTQRQFEVGAIQRRETMLRQIEGIRAGVVESIIRIEEETGESLDLVLQDQLRKLEAVRAELQRLTQETAPTLTDPNAGQPMTPAAPVTPGQMTPIEDLVPDRLAAPDSQQADAIDEAAGSQEDMNRELVRAIRLSSRLGETLVRAFQSGEVEATELLGQVLQIVGSAVAIANPVGGALLSGIGGIVGAIGLASGGVVTGPTLAVVGEGREDEAVLPLSRLEGMMQQQGGADPALRSEMRALRSDVQRLAERPVTVQISRRASRDVVETGERERDRVKRR